MFAALFDGGLESRVVEGGFFGDNEMRAFLPSKLSQPRWMGTAVNKEPRQRQAQAHRDGRRKGPSRRVGGGVGVGVGVGVAASK